MPRDPTTYPTAWPTFVLAAETGRMELAVAETAYAGLTRPQRVTEVLSQCLAQVDNRRPTSSLLRSLSVGSREYLLQQVAADCRPVEDWFETGCNACGERFDMLLDLAAMPRAEVPGGFPVVTLEQDGETLHFEVPNGGHEEVLASASAPHLREFLRACALDAMTEKHLDTLSANELEALDLALDAQTPETADSVNVDCPACSAPQIIAVDPLAYAFPAAGGVLRDVHLLSSTYSWSEEAVLDMPTRRRRSYVKMIAAGRVAS